MELEKDFMWLLEQCGNSKSVTDKKTKLKCSDTLKIYNIQKKFIIPNFKVGFIEPESIQITLNHSNESTVLKTNDCGNFFHNFTYNISNNKKLSDIYCLDNPEDEISPGKIIETKEFFLVVVYKINRVEVDEDGANRIFKREKNAYFSQLNKRTIEKNIYLFVIITTPGSIVTNIDKMPQNLVDTFISRYLFSISIGEKIENELKINVFDKIEISKYQQQYESIFKSINIDLPSDTYFTKKVIENCTSPVNENDFKICQQHIQHAAKLAQKKLSDEVMHDGKLNPTVIKQKRLKEIDKKYHELCLSQGSNVRKYSKSIIQLPYIVLKVLKTNSSVNDMDLLKWNIGNSDDITHSLIKQSIQCIKQGSFSSFDGTDKDEIANINLMKNYQHDDPEEHKIRLTKYYRVKPTISFNVGVELAKLGVDYDEYKNNKDVRAHYNKKNSTFSLRDTDTKDIDDWLKLNDHFKCIPDDYLESKKYSSVSLALKAIEKSSTNLADIKFSKNKLDRFLSSRIGRWAKLISDIAIELSICQGHTVESKEWILKKLRNYNLYILYKPDTYGGFLYFTLFWNNCDVIFSRGQDNDSCWVTKNFNTDGFISWIDVITSSSPKLVNWIKLESQLLSNLVFECENYKTAFMQDEDLFTSENLNDKIIYARQSFLLSILVMMNDRFSLDELMSHTRFMIMEGFKSLPLVPNPGKMLNKFPIMYRGRMEIWIANKLFKTSKKIIQSFGFKCSSVDNNNVKFKWTGLFDPFLHVPLETPDQIINSMYYNYSKNKNEKNLTYNFNTLKIMSKILTYEEKLPDKNNYLGNESRSDLTYNTHEFSPEIVRVMSEKLGEKLKYKLGPSWKTIIRDEIFNDLNEQDLEFISTLKASSIFTETSTPNFKEQTKRPKVAEAVKALWIESGKKDWKAMHLLLNALKTTKNSGGLYTDLYQKQQHGGLREIYIMSISSKIIQLVIEQIGCTLCKQFKSEIITHPNLKHTTPADHCEQEKQMKKSTGANITICTSDDATKWNQGHFITKFGIMLCQLTDPLFHPFIINALDLWTRKKIHLPFKLLKTFDRHISNKINKLSDENYLNKMYQCYKGSGKEKWMSPKADYIQTKSGMMQGILHLTSSLFHTLIQEFMKDEAKNILEKTFVDTDSVVTVMQSSDDSGMIISLTTDDENDAVIKMLACTKIFYMKHEIGKMIGIYPSEKSTVGTINIFEFNSEFFIWHSLIRPTRKWICAVNNIFECDSLYARQEKNYSLISDILKGGGSGITAWFCQISQAMLYYRLLGCSISPLWSRYAEKLINILDPTLGFYYIDNAKYCGLASCRFGLWFLSKKSCYLSKKIKNILIKTAKKRQQDKEDKEQLADLYDIMGVLSVDIVTSSSITNTNDKKEWNDIVNNLHLDPQWMDKVESCPLILYQRAQNADEFDLRLAVKMHAPGIGSELYQDNNVAKIITFSIHVLGKYVLKPGDFIKTNLHNLENQIQQYSALSEEQENILFPLRNGYASLVHMAKKISITGTVVNQDLKKKKFNMILFKSPVVHDFSLEKLVAWKWFNIDIPELSRQVSQSMFDDYKKNIKWLNDTPTETLIKSPFLNQIMMKHYFSSTELDHHVVQLNAAPVNTAGTNEKSALSLFMSQNMWPNWNPHLEQQQQQLKYETETAICADNLHLLSQGIYMTVQSEMKQELVNNIIFHLLKISDLLQAPSLKIYRSPRPILYLMQQLALEIPSYQVEVTQNSSKIKFDNKEILTKWIVKCIDLSVGCFGTFVLKQKNINGKNRGPFIWSGRINEFLVRIHGDSYENYDTCVTKIVVNKSEELGAAWPMFKQWAIDHNATLNIKYYRSYDTVKEEKVIARVINNRLCPETLTTIARGIPVVISNSILLTIDDAWFECDAVHIQADEKSVSVKIRMTIDKQDNPNKFITAVYCPMDLLEKSIGFLPINTYDYLRVNEFWRYFVTLQSSPINQVDIMLQAIMLDNLGIICALGFNDKKILLKKLRESFWYCYKKMTNLPIKDKENIGKINDNKLKNRYIDLKNLSNDGLLEKKLVEEFVSLDKKFHDQVDKEALEKDLTLYTGDHQAGVFNVVESCSMGKFSEVMPKPLIAKWMQQSCVENDKITLLTSSI